MIQIASNFSLMSVLLNEQSSLTKLIPQKILETIFRKKIDNFECPRSHPLVTDTLKTTWISFLNLLGLKSTIRGAHLCILVCI